MADTIIFKSSSDNSLDSKERVVKRSYTKDLEEEYTVKELEAKIDFFETRMNKCTQCQNITKKLESLKTLLSNTKSELSIS